MQRIFILFGYVIICNVFRIEARVFCQDSHAEPWVPNGYTCPVVCASVLDAIDKLIMLDYKRSVREQLGGRQKLNTRLFAYDHDYNDDIKTNYYQYLRRKSSAVDENEKRIDSFDDNLENMQRVDKNSEMNTEIEDKEKYNAYKMEGYTNFDVIAKNSKDFTDIDEYNKVEYAKTNKDINIAKNTEILTNLNANTKKTKEKTDKNNHNEKYKDKNVKSQTDTNQIDVEDLKILENIKNVKGILRRSYSNQKTIVTTTEYDFKNNIDVKYDSNNNIDKENEKYDSKNNIDKEKYDFNNNIDVKYDSKNNIDKEKYDFNNNIDVKYDSKNNIDKEKYDFNNNIDVKYDSKNNIDKENDKCWFLEKFKPNLLIGKVVRRKCTRRSNFDAKFVNVMTNVLNKYVDTAFRFTEEMTEILLENIFGKNTDLRNNIFDVNRLLNYLRKSLDRHKTHLHKPEITLVPKHCLTVALPGCFCRPGFVESSGQCVKPEDCVTDENYLQYLSRIVVL